MDETMKNSVTEELLENESVPEAETDAFSNDELKSAIEAQIRKVGRQNMLIGAQTMCSVVLEKILRVESAPGKRTMNDYKRLIKDIRQFCETGLSRKINADGEPEPVDNNTKLMEEPNEGNINESNGESDSSN